MSSFQLVQQENPSAAARWMRSFFAAAAAWRLRLGCMLAAFGMVLPCLPAAQAQPGAPANPPVNIKLWNGNKTSARQAYEQEVLQAALDATKETYGPWTLSSDTTTFPTAEEEGSVFDAKGFDIFGTVMGNAKLARKDKIVVPIQIMKGLLGYRILIIRQEDRKKFEHVHDASQLQQLRLGIPETWADAELFRENGYKVVEKGSFDDLFTRLAKNEFDYVSFGANEVASVFTERAAPVGKLAMDTSLLIYYPFPVVYYVNPNNKLLAERVTAGLQAIIANGTLDRIFARHFAATLAALHLPERRLITLRNPLLPKEMQNAAPVLVRPARPLRHPRHAEPRMKAAALTPVPQ